MARPQIPIDPEQVEKLASLGCKNSEIADFFGCSPETIERRFAPELTKGRAQVRISLRRWQLEAARKGNATLLVWLGKQMLGQRDKSEEELEVEKKALAQTLSKEDLAEVIKLARAK